MSYSELEFLEGSTSLDRRPLPPEEEEDDDVEILDHRHSSSAGSRDNKSEFGHGSGSGDHHSPSKSSSDKKQKKCPCPGCQRQYGVSKSFFDSDELVEWHNEGSTLWCADCTNVYRTIYEADHPKMLFRGWLQMSSENRMHFLFRLAASIMLRMEDGKQRVRAPAIEQRVAALKNIQSLEHPTAA